MMKVFGNKNWLFFFIILIGWLAWGFFNHKSIVKIEAPRENTPLPIITDDISTTNLISQEAILMGSKFSFIVEADKELALKAIRAATDRLQALESKLTSWHPSSDIFRVNEHAGISPVSVNKETFFVLKLAKKIHIETAGAFDITIGAVWELWPFRNPKQILPTKEQIQAHLKLVDASLIEMNEKTLSVYLPHRGMKLNLGGIGKGYAAKIAIQTMVDMGIKQAAISAGGDIYLLGKKTTGPWKIAIQNPRHPNHFIERFIIGDSAVATSGDYERYLLKDGKRINHIIDPSTGYPAKDCQSVTIITADPTLADAYATAVFVMGVKNGMAWIEDKQGIEALIIDAKGILHPSSGWKQITGKENKPTKVIKTVINEKKHPQSPTRTTPTMHLGVLEGRGNRNDMIEIPAGNFLSGDKKHNAHTKSFLIDRTEVTNQQYQQFLEMTNNNIHQYSHPNEPTNKDHTPRYWREYRSPLFRKTIAAQLAPFNNKTFKQPTHPVIGIDWWDAYAFARWAGKRLPTKIEWEKAARGTDGRIWPWGNQWDYKKANTGGEKWGELDGFTYSAPAQSFPEGLSIYGCLNMAGNVSEWTQEGYVMGGSSKNTPSGVRCSAKVLRKPDFRSFDIGFRCAADQK